jgi:hypothetical protein
MTFYEIGSEVLKLKKGIASNMLVAVRVSGPGLESHLTWGRLMEQPNRQLFAPYAPEIATGSFIQVRQDVKDDDTIDVSLICPDQHGNFPIKTKVPWHHQVPNKSSFYYTQFNTSEKCLVQIGIGSGLTEPEFFNEMFDDINKNWQCAGSTLKIKNEK